MAAICVGGWYFWKGKKPELPKWTWLESWRKERATTNKPSRAQTNAIPRVRTNPPAPTVVTNPAPPTTVTNVTPPLPETAEHAPRQFRNVSTVLDAQIALARKGISVGPIDGAAGNNMRQALLVWQIHNKLPVSGELDAETKAALLVEEPLFIQYTINAEDLRRLMTVPSTWLGKSEAKRLDYETILELVAERGRSSVGFIRKLNPQIRWTNVLAGTHIKIPRIDPPPILERAAFVRVHLYSKTLDVFGKSTNLIAHFPCSIAAKVEKRPIGRLFVARAASGPTYSFDPAIFPESEEARKIGRKLTIPSGPNNPVGTAWIGLDRPGYGIHGTPRPEQVGRTESHGCFRLANWNAEHLLQLAWVGLPVYVEP